MPEARIDELWEFALERLPSMRSPDGAMCYEVQAPDLEPRGRSLRYSAIVLLGLLRAARRGSAPTIDTGALKDIVLRELADPALTPGDLGLLLWADARSHLEAPERLLGALDQLLERTGGLGEREGLELSWLAIGCAAAAAAGCRDPRAERYARAMIEHQLARAETPSGLFLHTESGRRARFPNFATQIYGVLALSLAARERDDSRALAAATRAADKLLELRRPDGGWPWIFDTERGRVVEPYEVYSVHQDAMAPMALCVLADASGDTRYRDAAVSGLEWIWGRNELGVEMLDREAGILYRSIRRRRPFDRGLLYANTATAMLGRPLLARARGPLELNKTDRPYHLGWVLEAWSGWETSP